MDRRRFLLTSLAGALALSGAFGLSITMWGLWWEPPTWTMWTIQREWEAARTPGAPPDKQWLEPWVAPGYADRRSCEMVARFQVPDLLNRAAPDPAVGVNVDPTIEGGLGVVTHAMGGGEGRARALWVGETTSTQFICLQVGQRRADQVIE